MSKLKYYNLYLILIKSSLPRPETELILAFLLNKSREYLLTHPEIKISLTVYKKFKILEAKRLKNWPLAYLIGHKEFYGLDFKVSPAVLTPRPETEMMVEEIIGLISDKNRITPKNETVIVDLGTGSGAIIIALALELRRLLPGRFSKIRFRAVDISSAALKMAKKNAGRHNLTRRITFYHGNLLTPLKLSAKKLAGRELIITANLPYLTPTQIKKSPSISREPRLALDGGPDGLKYYQELFRQIAALNLSDTSLRIFCEIDPTQTLKIKALVKKYFPKSRITIKPDLAGRPRLALISL